MPAMLIPTPGTWQQLLAQLEGAAWGVVCGSGMAAISALLATMQQGQRIVASNRLYGRTVQSARSGAETASASPRSLSMPRSRAGSASFGRGPTRILFVETMSNPLLRLVDITALAQLAHERDCLLVVDNTFATPVLTKPLDLGADLVMESLTKMICGPQRRHAGIPGRPGRGPCCRSQCQHEHLGPGLQSLRLLAGGAGPGYAGPAHADGLRAMPPSWPIGSWSNPV